MQAVYVRSCTWNLWERSVLGRVVANTFNEPGSYRSHSFLCGLHVVVEQYLGQDANSSELRVHPPRFTNLDTSK